MKINGFEIKHLWSDPSNKQATVILAVRYPDENPWNHAPEYVIAVADFSDGVPTEWACGSYFFDPQLADESFVLRAQRHGMPKYDATNGSFVPRGHVHPLTRSTLRGSSPISQEA